MVCLGNICRSPLAEGILKSKTDSQFVLVDSAGTADIILEIILIKGLLPLQKNME